MGGWTYRTVFGLGLTALVTQVACVRLLSSEQQDDPTIQAIDGLRDRAAAGSDGGLPDAPDSSAPAGDGLDLAVLSLDGDSYFFATHRVYLAIQHTESYIQPLAYDAVGATARVTGPAILLDMGRSLRSLVGLADGRILAGHGHEPRGALLRPGDVSTTILTVAQSAASPEAQLSDLHGMCQLVDGSLVLGEYSPEANNAISQFTLTGDRATFQREVRRTTAPGTALANCQQRAGALWLTVVNATNDSDGDLLKMTFSGNWTLTERFDTSNFHVGSATPIFDFVAHTDGNLYLFPQHRFGTRISALVRCSVDDISANACVAAGPLPTSGSTALDGPDVIFGASQLPGDDRLVFTTNSALYVYRIADGQYDEVLAYSDQPAIPSGQVRGLVVTPRD